MNSTENTANSNGFDYVDLGLPSGTLWATCNVGASKPSDYGLYFQWGDTKGYAEDQIGIGGDKKTFSWNDYKFSIDGSTTNFSKYTNPCDALDLDDDAAHVNMGGDWHIPTNEQIQELIDNTISTRSTLDGVRGMTFTSKKDASKFIFIPLAGYICNGLFNYFGTYGYIWSSMLGNSYNEDGQYFLFTSDYAHLNNYYRCCGFPVRGVIEGKNWKKMIKNMDLKKINDYWQSNRLLCSIGIAAILILLFEIIPKVIMFITYVAVLSAIIYFAPQIINYVKKWKPNN